MKSNKSNTLAYSDLLLAMEDKQAFWIVKLAKTTENKKLACLEGFKEGK